MPKSIFAMEDHELRSVLFRARVIGAHCTAKRLREELDRRLAVAANAEPERRYA